MGILDVKNCTKRFGGLVAVRDLNMSLTLGALYGLIGPNGAGKTTVFNLITGVYTPDEGSIELEGKTIHKKKPSSIANLGMSRTFQNIRLLKEASVQDKKNTKPKLDKKSLTGDDFKQGMSGVEDKAKACYKGTQGTALVKLTVGPTGKITKIAVAGDFAGKPEATCIAAALRGATFPPWDGGPQSFTYAVLLSD